MSGKAVRVVYGRVGGWVVVVGGLVGLAGVFGMALVSWVEAGVVDWVVSGMLWSVGCCSSREMGLGVEAGRGSIFDPLIERPSGVVSARCSALMWRWKVVRSWNAMLQSPKRHVLWVEVCAMVSPWVFRGGSWVGA